jgi:hypothetical protein
MISKPLSRHGKKALGSDFGTYSPRDNKEDTV